jgi:hypothetical protein
MPPPTLKVRWRRIGASDGWFSLVGRGPFRCVSLDHGDAEAKLLFVIYIYSRERSATEN